MTWVVGRSVIFGYAAGVSDVRVTLEDDSEHDCLQKIYEVGRLLALGFAGSVGIGFSMVERASADFQRDEPDIAWQPEAAAGRLAVAARGIFAAASEVEQSYGSELMLLGAHPSETNGDTPWPKCSVYKLCAPDFVPYEAGPGEVLSIGSGSEVEQYRSVLKAAGDNLAHLKMESGFAGGAGYGLLSAMRDAIEEQPVLGISPHLQFCVVGLGGVDISHFDRVSFNDEQPDLTMPPLARSRAELIQRLFGKASVVRGAHC
jgi:hypothetical protein